MTKKDMNKLTSAGFCLIKMRYEKRNLLDKHHVIEVLNAGSEDWTEFAKFKKKVEAKEFYRKLLEHPKTISPYAFY